MTFASDLRLSADAPEGYGDLPMCVKMRYTPQEWLWLSDTEKATLVQRETEPDWIEP
jgi:hypothetical protein